ncbi:MAG: bifunctional heptose 7-phosphate kinase/heptose 1-phosphate adenyltransferase, partial [Anaerolineae bacterium]
ERLSREAPIPVLAFSRRFHLPGGAANPAHNIAALGGQAHVLGIIGDDGEGEQLTQALQQAGIATDGVVVDAGRPTTLKTRVLAEGTRLFPQQVARIDRQERRPIDGPVEQQLIDHIRRLTPQINAVLVSDYKSGVVTPATIEAVRLSARRHNKLLTVDSQGDLYNFAGFDVVRAHRRDAEVSLGRRLVEESDFEAAGRQLRDELGANLVLISRGEEGMSLTTPDGYHHIPAANRTDVFDVTGAGDTVIAVLTLALAAGADPVDAARLSSHAAGLVIRKLGNATVTPEELQLQIAGS